MTNQERNEVLALAYYWQAIKIAPTRFHVKITKIVIAEDEHLAKEHKELLLQLADERLREYPSM